MNPQPIPVTPRILTSTVGSYSPIDWLAAPPREQAVLDFTAVVISTQRRAGIDLPTDGERYRFDVNHPDTNGKIEYFISRMGGIDMRLGLADARAFRGADRIGWVHLDCGFWMLKRSVADQKIEALGR